MFVRNVKTFCAKTSLTMYLNIYISFNSKSWDHDCFIFKISILNQTLFLQNVKTFRAKTFLTIYF